jgi:predicted MFS family arabinose efflux permease
MGCALYDAAFSTLGRLYGSEARRPITTLTLFGGFASTVCWPLSAYLVETFGWRETCLFYAAIHLLISAPVLLLLLPRKAAIDQASRPVEPCTARKQRGLVLLTLIFITGSAIFSIVSIHLLTFLQGLGFALAGAVALGALIGPSQVGARGIEIVFGSRYHPLWTLMISTLLIATGILLLAFGSPLAAACLVLYGAGNGIWSISRGTVPLALFGADNFPTIMGRLAKAAFLSQAFAPFAAAQLITWSGAHVALGAVALLAVLNIGLVALLLVRCRYS